MFYLSQPVESGSENRPLKRPEKLRVSTILLPLSISYDTYTAANIDYFLNQFICHLLFSADNMTERIEKCAA